MNSNTNSNNTDDTTKLNHFDSMKQQDTLAYLLSYVVWDTKFPRNSTYVSLIHNGWAYPILGSVFDTFENKYFRCKTAPITQYTSCHPKNTNTNTSDENTDPNSNTFDTYSATFYYYKISLSMLPNDLVFETNRREPCGLIYYPRASPTHDFLIFKAFPENDTSKEISN
uniref:Uncharacterized protein n=1 Tax=viral metagenome TaxID=1070528 RepID=A0A6C0E5J9_9ZZZZ